jgi:hypothetical protein
MCYLILFLFNMFAEKNNLADLFTKEMRDTSHFVELRDLMLRPRLSPMT